MPNISPFCLKVETFLRANDIKYEVKESWITRSNEGKLPFIELNGKQVADSQVIIWTLMDHFKIDEGLSTEQQAKARAIERMIEGSTYFPLLYFNSYENAQNIVNPKVSGLPIPNFVIPFLAKKMAEAAKKRLSAGGILRHPREVVVEIFKRDLDALKYSLGDKKFFLGARPTVPDFTFFGHFGVVYHFPFQQPAKTMLEQSEYAELRSLIERIKLHYWQKDWPQNKE